MRLFMNILVQDSSSFKILRNNIYHKNDLVTRIIQYAKTHKNESLYQHTCDKILPLSQDWGNNIHHKNDLVARLLELVKSHKNGDKTIYYKNDTRMSTILVSLPICVFDTCWQSFVIASKDTMSRWLLSNYSNNYKIKLSY